MTLAEVLEELFDEAARKGLTIYRRLGSGLMLGARVNGKTKMLVLSRPNNPKGPSTQEAHTCAKHAGWGDAYGFKANPERKTITIWTRPS